MNQCSKCKFLLPTDSNGASKNSCCLLLRAYHLLHTILARYSGLLPGLVLLAIERIANMRRLLQKRFLSTRGEGSRPVSEQEIAEAQHWLLEIANPRGKSTTPIDNSTCVSALQPALARLPIADSDNSERASQPELHDSEPACATPSPLLGIPPVQERPHSKPQALIKELLNRNPHILRNSKSQKCVLPGTLEPAEQGDLKDPSLHEPARDARPMRRMLRSLRCGMSDSSPAVRLKELRHVFLGRVMRYGIFPDPFSKEHNDRPRKRHKRFPRPGVPIPPTQDFIGHWKSKLPMQEIRIRALCCKKMRRALASEWRTGLKGFGVGGTEQYRPQLKEVMDHQGVQRSAQQSPLRMAQRCE